MEVTTIRQNFDIVIQPNKQDLRNFRITGQSQCPPFLNLLVTGLSILLFAFVNTLFIVKIAYIVNGMIYSSITRTFPCDTYYCDQTAFNFINYYQNYRKCNPSICQAVICDNYVCSQYQNYGINYYYACQPKCGLLQDSPVPPKVRAAYIISITAACCFGFAAMLSLVYGIGTACYASHLSFSQRLALILNFTWPKYKYYTLRNRINWEGVTIDLKSMVIVEIFVTFFYFCSLIMYLILQIYQFWQTWEQISCFYFLIWATVIRISLIGEVAGPFYKAHNQLVTLRMKFFILS